MARLYVARDVRNGGMGIVYVVEHLDSHKEKIILRLALKTFQSRYLWNEEAIRRFEREATVREVIALDGNQHEAHNNAAVCLTKLGRFEEARRVVEQAVELKPDYAEAWSNLGAIYEKLQR